MHKNTLLSFTFDAATRISVYTGEFLETEKNNVSLAFNHFSTFLIKLSSHCWAADMEQSLDMGRMMCNWNRTHFLKLIVPERIILCAFFLCHSFMVHIEQLFPNSPSSKWALINQLQLHSTHWSLNTKEG